MSKQKWKRQITCILCTALFLVNVLPARLQVSAAEIKPDVLNENEKEADSIENGEDGELADKTEGEESDETDSEEIPDGTEEENPGEDSEKTEENEGEKEDSEEPENPDDELDDDLEKTDEEESGEQGDELDEIPDTEQEADEQEPELKDEESEMVTEDGEADASGKCGDNLTWTLKDRTLTISGTGEMWDYSYASHNNSAYTPWHKYAWDDKVDLLIIEQGITSIGDYAFFNICFRGELVIPDSVTSIGDSSFRDCSGFTGGLVIPDSVTSIGGRAFEGCSGFTGGLVIPDSMTSIGVLVFQDCSGFTGELVIPDSVTSIGAMAFEGCSGFTGELVIPDSVTSIGDEAFKGCSGFTGELVISESVTNIERLAFDGCSGFTGELVIPDSVTSIGVGAFRSCSGFTGELAIPDSVTSIYSSAFEGCSGFTGGLVIPDSVEFLGDSVFADCSGFTGELVISESVTGIYRFTFWGCSGFTGELVIPGNVECIETEAFYGCNGFTGELVIPEGVASIGEGAFWNCSGFTGGLVIPKSVTFIDGNVFNGCTGLNGRIYIPESVYSIVTTCFIGIPNKTIYGVSGSYAEIYAKNNNIPFIAYNPDGPENKDIELSGDYANIYIMDVDFIPVAGALVNNVATDANGYIALPVAEGSEEKYIGVTADGYIAEMSVKTLVPNGTYYIALQPTDGEFAVVYAKATINGTATNLLADKIYLQHTGEDISASSGKAAMEIEVRARGDVKSYALLQNDKVIASSTDGKFSLPVLPRNGSNSLTNLEAQKNITVRATDVDGKIAASRIGIYVSPEGAADIKEEDKSGSFSIGSKVGVTLPDTIPFLGGREMSYGLENPLPFDLTVERNGQVKIAINKSVSESMDAFKEDYDKLSERARNLSQAASAFGGEAETFGAGCLSARVTAKGYGEGYIDMTKPGTFEIKVGVILTGKGSAKWTQYFMAGAVPFYVTVEAGAELSGAVTLSVKCGNSQIQSEGGVGTLSGKVYLAPKAGVGVDGLISVGISGTGACNYTWKPKDDYTKIWLSAYLELQADCFGWDLNLWKSPEQTYTIYESPQKSSLASAQTLYEGMAAKVYDSGAYTIMDRSYQDKEPDLARAAFDARNETDSFVQSYVYPGAKPKLVMADNRYYLFWLQDISGRSAENRAAVVYAFSDDGANFTSPVQLVAESENQTLDNGIDVYVDGGKIYVCWQDASESFAPGAELNEVAKKQQISYAVIDASTGSVLSHETVTENAGCYLQPKIYAAGGRVQIAWIHNSMTSESGIWGTDNQESLQKYDGATGKIETFSIGNGNEKIVSMDGVADGSQAGVVYALDTDGDLQTISDRIIYLDTRLGSAGSRTALTSDAGTYNNPVAEGGSIYWYADGNISYTVIGSNAVQQIYEEARADIGSNFCVISEGNQTEIIWNAIEYETGKAALYSINSLGNGQWSNPYVLEQTDSEMTGHVSGCMHNGVPYLSYMHIRNMEDGSKCHSLCVTHKKDVTDTVLNYAGYEYGEFKPGQALPITVELTNRGNTVVENVDVKMDGVSLGTETINLGAGETGTFVLSQYIVPENIGAYSEHVFTVSAALESEVSDNNYTVGIGYTDAKVLCSQRLQNEHTWLDISVLNDSSISSDVTLNIRADKEDGEILYTEDLGVIEGGKGVSMTVSLQKYEDSCCTWFVEAVTGTEDVVEGNNIVFVYTGFGTDIQGGELVPDTRFHTVSFQSNGGSEVESQQVEDGRSVSEPPVPVRDGYRFVGWCLNGELYDFYSLVTGDITLEAIWEEYAVLAAPSSNLPSGSEVEIGTKIVLTCAASGAEIYYTLDGSIPDRTSMPYLEPIIVLGDTTITAIAVREGFKDSPAVTFAYRVAESRPGTYIVVFQSNGGTEIESQEVEEGGKIVKPENPVREGYRFAGWYNMDGELHDFGLPVTGNMRLDAVWVELETLDMPVSNIVSGKAVPEGSKVILSTGQTGVKIYYTLDGTTPSNSSPLFRNPLVINEEVTIKAIAVKKGYKDSPIATFSYTISTAKDDLGDILPEDYPEEGAEAIPAGLWIAGVDENGYTYTGKAIKPEVRVYDYKTLLQPAKDYSISYRNNTKVNDGLAVNKAPAIIVTGKGNYSGKETENFIILAKDISEKDITAEDITVSYNKKLQKAVPVIWRSGRKLKNKTDYTVEYPDLAENDNAYKAPGTYTVLVKGIGGYQGERSVHLTITEAKLMSKTSVSRIAAQVYTGEEITTATMAVMPVVKSGKVILKEGVHYTVSYEDNVEIGTATMILTGTGKETPQGIYSGNKKVTFKITGGNLKKAVVTGIPKTLVYTGNEMKENSPGWETHIKLTVTGTDKSVKELTEGVDYTVEYQKNVTPGTAKVLFTGINGYSGTLSKSFKITAYDIQKDTDGLISVEIDGQPVYAKGGSKPEPVVKYGNIILEQGKDYTLSYKNNTSVNDGSNAKKIPTVTVKGKGCFRGNTSVTYTIGSQDIGKMNIAISDKVYQNRKNIYKSAPRLTDINGKALKAGTDYDKNYICSYGEETHLADGSIKSKGEIIGANDILPAGTPVIVTVTGKGNYSGTLKGQYRIVASNISKAKITIPAQIYSGNEITLDKGQVTVKMGKEVLLPEDYEIVENSYKNNVKKGTASVIIKGTGNYGGTKTVNFKITAKNMLWWWRK